MAIVVEDGTIVTGANSFVTTAFFEAYVEERDLTNADFLVATDELRDAAVLYSGGDLAWGYAWRGSPVEPFEHPWPFPRYALIDDDGFVYTFPNSESIGGSAIPLRLQHAQCELALGHLGEALNTIRDRAGEIKSEKVGSLAVEYFDGAPAERSYPFVEKLLAGLHDGKKMTGTIIQEMGFAG